MNLVDTLIIEVNGKNIVRFIKRLNTNNIEILNVNSIKREKAVIEILKKDYEKIEEIKTIYSIIIIEEKGFVLFKKKILKNKFLILFLFLTIIFIFIVSNIIFTIEVVTNDSALEEYIIKQLNNYDIDEYKFFKSYEELQVIKEQIIADNSDLIEWLEIERVGIKYVVKLNLRVLNEEVIESPVRNLVASKDGVIKSVVAVNGQILKNINDYVKKGDIIVSGDIYFLEEIKETISAEGTVYAETWYNVEVTYPLVYYEEYKTGNQKTVYTFNFLNFSFDLFNFNNYDDYESIKSSLLKNDLIPLSLNKEIREEKVIINQELTADEAVEAAILKAQETLLKTLDTDEYIIDYKCLETNIYTDEVNVLVFITVYENITDYDEIVR
ncbi:MAG: sporulation protein YqfD [Mycoplasmatota bacterium]